MKKSIGFVKNLEEHFPSEGWKTYFDDIYLQADGDVVENPNNTIREINFLLQSADLKPEDQILDLCCGQGRHSIELANRGFKNISGMDYSEYLINLARQRASSSGLSINFEQRDIRLGLPKNSYDCITILGNSFGYFDSQEDELKVLKAIAEALRPQGKLAMNFLDGEWVKTNFQPQSWEWINQHSLICRERVLSLDKTRLLSRAMVFDLEQGFINERFLAFRLYSKEYFNQMLEKVGLTSIQYHKYAAIDSELDQDLGMMGNLLFLTASADI